MLLWADYTETSISINSARSFAMSSSNAGVQTVSTELPAMPLTLEGLSVLHQMFRFRWPEWRKLDASRQAGIAREAAAVFAASEELGQSARSEEHTSELQSL